MSWSPLRFRVNYTAILIGLILLSFLPAMYSSSASIVLESSGSKLELVILNEEPQQENNKLSFNIQSRLDLIEKDVEQLKKENQNQNEDIRLLKNKNNNHEEEIGRLKTQIEHLIHQKSYENFAGETINEDFIRMPVKRSERSGNKPKSTAADVSYASWAKLEISDKVIGYMDYDTYTVKIYDHASNKDVNIKNEEKKYYFEPIGQLDHLSAKSDFNNVSAVKTAEMVFKVNMWSDAVRNEVHTFISEGLQLGPVNINLVRVLPLDRVIVYNEIDSSPNFEIEQNWIDYKSDRYLKFKYICEKLKRCNALATQMKTIRSTSN